MAKADEMASIDYADAQRFIEKWHGVSGSERANYQLFVTGLCELLQVAKPEPAREDTRDNAYVFERRVTFAHGNGTESVGFVDCYKRNAFVLEAKRIRIGPNAKGFDEAMMRAHGQAQSYARALPAAEGRPPFVVIVDVGHVIELYADFSCSGATYTPFPDARSHRIVLPDLLKLATQDRLRALWNDPMALDPSRVTAKVTRQVAVELAAVARSLEADGNQPEQVAAFLTRCLFSMFAEDVELLPRTESGVGAFVGLLREHHGDPKTLSKMLKALWTDMDRGGFSAALAKDVLRFNGKLFKDPEKDGYVINLNKGQIDGLLAAAKADWREVEPAIFGTLLERALSPSDRHALGAHYTPRAYVERLVVPTIVEPLRQDWAAAQAAAFVLATEASALKGKKREDKLLEARSEIRRFHHALCTVRVLDPACGTGNFLYVTLEHLKRLEGEVLSRLEALGDVQGRLGIEGETVSLRQLRGIELNERAAALAELVLWIGYLQWHIRTFGHASVAEPVVHDYKNIECKDAVLAYAGVEVVRDPTGRAITRWDGEHTKSHPVTGQQVPDEDFQVPTERYIRPQKASWPEVDFIVGNPPFIGASTVRRALGDGYAEALRSAWTEVPESADFVMHWWQAAAEKVANGDVRRFGLITTNSLPQTFNRRVVEAALTSEKKIHICFAVPDHPWVDSADGAAVRISMSVGSAGSGEGDLWNVTREKALSDGSADVMFSTRRGVVHADLRVGANVASAVALQANANMSNPGLNCMALGLLFQERSPFL